MNYYQRKAIKKLLLYFLLSILFIILYIELSRFWVDCGGLSGNNKYLELPVLLISLLILYFPSKSVLKNVLLMVTPIVGLYVLYDVFYHFLARSARPSDLSNASTLNDFSPLMSIGLVMILCLIIIPIFYMIYKFKKESKTQTFYAIMTTKIIILIGIFYYIHTDYLTNYALKKFHYIDWSQSLTIKKNGRFSSFLYYGILSKQASKKLSLYKNNPVNVNKLLFGNTEIQNKRNIYIVILESFIDPRLIKNTSFNRSPLSENMRKYLGGEEFSYVTSPVYGGNTAQAEFEIFTGSKALSKVNSIEFNTLRGKQISGFVNTLKQNGYQAYATIASNSGYFNSKEAYKSIGFNESIFLEENDAFQLKEDDKRIFDGDAFNYNLKKLQGNNFRKPFLNYTLGMYGHFPYDRNIAYRPDIISVSHKDTRVHKIANQFYYRTKALASYISNILTIDPNSIIYISSDHLPPLLTDGVDYTKPNTTNISLLLVDGKVVDVNGLYHYDIPRLIFKKLNNDNEELKKIDESIYEEIYFKILSESL